MTDIDEQTTVLDLWRIFQEQRLVICACLAVALILSVTYISLAQTYYRVELTAVPSIDENSGTGLGLSSQLGSLSSIVGISTPVNTGLAVNLATLKSRKFTMDFLRSERLLGVLVPQYWDIATNNWRKDRPDAAVEGEDHAFAIFDRLRVVSFDRDTQLVTVSLEWKNANAAARVVNDLIARANQQLRAKKISETAERIKYLQAEMARNELAETRQQFAQLLESEIQSMMIANSRPDFAFRIVDPAVPTAEPSRPQRIFDVALSLLGGLLVGVSLALLRHYLNRLHKARSGATFA